VAQHAGVAGRAPLPAIGPVAPANANVFGDKPSLRVVRPESRLQIQRHRAIQRPGDGHRRRLGQRRPHRRPGDRSVRRGHSETGRNHRVPLRRGRQARLPRIQERSQLRHRSVQRFWQCNHPGRDQPAAFRIGRSRRHRHRQGIRRLRHQRLVQPADRPGNRDGDVERPQLSTGEARAQTALGEDHVPVRRLRPGIGGERLRRRRLLRPDGVRAVLHPGGGHQPVGRVHGLTGQGYNRRHDRGADHAGRSARRPRRAGRSRRIGDGIDDSGQRLPARPAQPPDRRQRRKRRRGPGYRSPRPVDRRRRRPG
jgi:hypothetical protein